MTEPIYSIADAAKLAGITPATLRSWESRYGWPRPMRLRNGFRAYSAELCDTCARVANLLRNGGHLIDIIVDGEPRFEVVQAERPSAPVDPYHFDDIPKPTTRAARDLRRDLENHLIARRDWAIEAAEKHLPFIHPSDRHLAVHAVVARYRECR